MSIMSITIIVATTFGSADGQMADGFLLIKLTLFVFQTLYELYDGQFLTEYII